MPAGDEIFQRLERATDSELRAMAIALREEKSFLEQRSRPEQLDFLSRWLRSDAGSAFRNRFRSDHALPYFKVLEDVVSAAASAASWNTPEIDEAIPVENLEDYIVNAFAFASTKTTSKLKRERARKQAEVVLHGGAGDASSPGTSTATRFSVGALLGGAGGLGAAAIGAVPLGLVLAAAYIGGPAVRRTTPAVLVLIHIRHRIRIEETLGGPS